MKRKMYPVISEKFYYPRRVFHSTTYAPGVNFKLLLSAILFFCAVLLCLPQEARAYGVGPHLTVGGGGGSDWNGHTFKTGELEYGGGIVFEMSLPGVKKFNYRLEFDYHNLHTNFGWTDYYIVNLTYTIIILGIPAPQNLPWTIFKYKNPTITGDMLSATSTFSYEIFRNGAVRLWLGPQLILKGCLHGVLGFWAGTGLAIGADFDIVDSVTLSVSAAVQGGGGLKFYSHMTTELLPVGSFSTVASIPVKSRTSQQGMTGNGALSFSALYHFGEDASGRVSGMP